jgi:hypothetical protein
MINQDDLQAFAMAATHIESINLTLAVMVGCSDDQIKTVKNLVSGWSDAISHPLLMLGICAELELNRLEDKVAVHTMAYGVLKSKIEDESTTRSRDRFSWELIKQVRLIREDSKPVEEVDATKSQLEKACGPAIEAVVKQYGQHNSRPSTPNVKSVIQSMPTSGASTDPDPSGTNSPRMMDSTATTATLTIPGSVVTQRSLGDRVQELAETTDLFQVRFNDIVPTRRAER